MVLAMAAGRQNRRSPRSRSMLREPACLLITCSFLCFPVTLAECNFLLSARTLPRFLHGSTMLSRTRQLQPLTRESRSARSSTPPSTFRTWRTCEHACGLGYPCSFAVIHMSQYHLDFDLCDTVIETYRVTHCRFGSRRSASAGPHWATHNRF
jgi:hypothetical protein